MSSRKEPQKQPYKALGGQKGLVMWEAVQTFRAIPSHPREVQTFSLEGRAALRGRWFGCRRSLDKRETPLGLPGETGVGRYKGVEGVAGKVNGRGGVTDAVRMLGC